ncbi:hypothetical protein Tcan_12404 [Toxocara canis]|uniref:Uncharacterized protein n=1 Tax=Toxocara canis TaxID=6265 RepID=A0A0B2W188_TOXCA|nr:hypothetical protein Tcan_12404 [Toxocara canis]
MGGVGTGMEARWKNEDDATQQLKIHLNKRQFKYMRTALFTCGTRVMKHQSPNWKPDANSKLGINSKVSLNSEPGLSPKLGFYSKPYRNPKLNPISKRGLNSEPGLTLKLGLKSKPDANVEPGVKLEKPPQPENRP